MFVHPALSLYHLIWCLLLAGWFHAHLWRNPNPRSQSYRRKTPGIPDITTTDHGTIWVVIFYQSLPFQKVQHKVTTLDAQPSSTTVASLLVSVTGLLLVSLIWTELDWSVLIAVPSKVDDSENPLNFSQVFQLQPRADSYYVYISHVLSRLPSDVNWFL